MHRGLSRDEWRVLWFTHERKKPPRTAPTLPWAHASIAKLGAWTGPKTHQARQPGHHVARLVRIPGCPPVPQMGRYFSFMQLA